MDATTIINRSPNASFEVVADEAILIHLVTGTYFSLNKVGTEFWQMLDGSATIADHAAKWLHSTMSKPALSKTICLSLPQKWRLMRWSILSAKNSN